jgi:hypothetical protein
MEKTRSLGIVVLVSGAGMILAYLMTVAGLIREGVNPEDYVDAGGTALASSYAVPMGALAIGIGIILLLAVKRDAGGESVAGRPVGLTSRAPFVVMAGGIAFLVLNVVMLRDLAVRVEAFESRTDFVPAGPAFEAERAETQLAMEKINAVQHVGMALAFAGLILMVSGPKRPKGEGSE